MRRLRWAFIFLCAACSIAAAANDIYLADVIKKPAYAKALTALLKSSGELPSWTTEVLKTRGDYVGPPVSSAPGAGTRYEMFGTCKTHDCGDNRLEVMF